MRFRESVKCKRCGLTTTYTNEVELKLWQGRPGCPACMNRRDDGHDDGQRLDNGAETMSAAAVVEWYIREVNALASLRLAGVVTADEFESALRDVRISARVALGLEAPGPLVADEP